MMAEKKKTMKLKVEEKVNYKMIGISSHENDYRLVWAINNQLRMQFVRRENLIVHNAKLKSDLEFSCYAFHDEDRYLNFRLISNRCPDGFLFPEIRKLDFVLQIIGEMDDSMVNNLVKEIRKIEIVSAVVAIRPQDIKNIEKMIPE
jgi:hypothetical protein